MGNILNFNVNKIDMRLSNAHYWDLYLAKGDYSIVPKDSILTGTCLVAHYDFDEPAIYAGTGATPSDRLLSLTTWDNATNDGFVLPRIGLTGIDNGLITFNKVSGDTGNTALLSALTASTLVIPSGETRLNVNRVTGMTGDYIYPMEIIPNTANQVGDYARLCGGFYQGYYKLDGYDYEVLPNRVPKGWTAEFWLRPNDECLTGNTGTILNDDYTGNTGFFLYFGTRAENKFWNQFEGLNTGTTSGCTSGATEWCTIPKEIDVSFTDDEGHLIPLDPPAYTFSETDNNFLIYSRGGGGACGSCGSCSSGTTCSDPFPTSGGKTVRNWTGGSYTFTGITQVVTDDRNPFLVYSRASGRCGGCSDCVGGGSGETVCSFSGFTSPLTELDKKADIVDNAIGFRITEDGRIGYRKLILTASCVNEVTVTGVTIEEQYSATGMVTDNQWQMISIRFVADTTLDECELEWKPARKGKLMFYVNRRLKFIVRDFDEFIARRLFEHKDKQLGVPYNISLGGGSQGLLESMTFDGQDPDDLNCIIQNNFAGTFIGDISQFRFYICDLSYCDIVNNYEQEVFRYTCTDCPEEEEFYLLQENGGTLLQEDGFYILNESQFLLQENGDLLLQENGDNLIE